MSFINKKSKAYKAKGQEQEEEGTIKKSGTKNEPSNRASEVFGSKIIR